MNFSIDIEPTNRCNAKCTFCPRDQTPHQGLMTPAIFEQALARSVEFRAAALEHTGDNTEINLCGLGEPLLNRHTADWVAAVRREGFDCGLSTNGALLDVARGDALLDAGLVTININVGTIGDEYEQVYQLPFEKVRDNVVRFAESAAGRCVVNLVLVDYKDDPTHVEAMKSYWRDHGIDSFLPFEIQNRGGALYVDHMQFEEMGETREARDRMTRGPVGPVCAAPILFLFVGYDGKYYLCCSDWKKEVAFGDVFDRSMVSLVEDKLRHVIERTAVCSTCNLDPTNRVAAAIASARAGTGSEEAIESVIAEVALWSEVTFQKSERLAPGVTDRVTSTARRRIPVVGR